MKYWKKSVFVLALSAAACASGIPVQEMSDARQAIRSAEEAGASRYSPQPLNMARQWLQQAQSQLEAGQYADARRAALHAREAAILAREQADVAKTP